MPVTPRNSQTPPSGPRTVDAVAELRTAGFGRFHLGLVVSIILATIFDGYDTLNPSYVIHYVVEPWHLDHSNTGFLVSSGLIGFLVGALVHGPVADRIGRRPVLLGALFGSGLFSLLTGVLTTGFVSFVTLRFLTGVFLGVIMPLGAAYINEFTPARSSNLVVNISISGYCLGGVAASVVGIYLTPAYGWHVLYWIGAASMVLAILLVPALPESVQFQVLRGRHRDITRILSRIRPDRAAAYDEATFAQPRHRASASEMLGTLLGRDYRRTSIALWVCAFMTLFCIYGLAGWLPEAMEVRGNGFATSFAFLAILQLAGIVGGIVMAYVSDRKWLGLPTCITVLMAIATVAMILVGIGGASTSDLIMVGFAGFGIIGGQSMLDVLSARSYPAHLRSTGTGSMFGVGRVGGILGPYLIGWLLDWSGGTTGIVFVVIAVAAAAAGITMLVIARDARGTTAPVDIPERNAAAAGNPDGRSVPSPPPG